VLVITHDREIAAALPRRVELRDGCLVDDRRTGDAHDDRHLPATP